MAKIQTGKLDVNAQDLQGKYPFFTCAKEPTRINSYSFDCECVLVAGNGDLNVKYYQGKFEAYQRTYVIEVQDKKLNTRFLYYLLNNYLERLRHLAIGGVIKYIKLENLTDIPLPELALDDQQKIVDVLDRVENLRQKRKQSLQLLDDFLRATFLDMFGTPQANSRNWNVGTIRDLVAEVKYGSSKKAGSLGAFSMLRMNNINFQGMWNFTDMKYVDLDNDEISINRCIDIVNISLPLFATCYKI